MEKTSLLVNDLKSIGQVPIDPSFPKDTAALHASVEGFQQWQTLVGIVLFASFELSDHEQASLVYIDLIAWRLLCQYFPAHVLVHISVRDIHLSKLHVLVV